MLSDCNFFLLRTPALPYQTIAELTPDGLREICRSPYVQEALFVASPDLFEVFRQWYDGTLTNPKDRDRVELTVTKYVLRMSYRSTPFGLFAGVSRGELGTCTTLRLAAPEQYAKHVRLDMDYLCALALSLARDPDIRSHLMYFPNSTIYRAGDSLRLVEYRVHNKVRTHHLVSLGRTTYLEQAILAATQGATIAEIANTLVDADVTLAEAEAYVYELLDSQVLVSRLEPSITGPGYLEMIIAELTPLPACTALVGHLTTLTQSLGELSAANSTQALPLYNDIARQLRQLGVSFELGQLFQVDLRKPTILQQLNASIVDDVRKATDLLSRLNRHDESPTLIAFKDAFRTRYEEAEVPLVQVLDSELGIGYPINSTSVSDSAPLLNGLVAAAAAEPDRTYRWTAWRQRLLEAYVETRRTNAAELTLTEEMLAPFLQQAAPPLPASCYAMISLLADSAQDLDDGNYQVVFGGTDGPSAARLIGRFSYLDDQLTEQLQECLRREAAAYPEAILAEVVHINQSRMGNVVIRPQLRSYEIPIMVQAGVAAEHCILLDDLLISLRGNTVVLRSKRLQREVIPRLSTAHNYGFNTLPAYRLLCDLQQQDQMLNCRWDWGLLQDADFLPRVVIGKVILARARWLLHAVDLKALATAPDDLAFMKELRARRNLPRWVTYREGDNELPFDLNNPLALRLLKSVLRNSSSAVLEERLLPAATSVVTDGSSSFLHELIIPLHNSSFAAAPPPLPPPLVQNIPRQFAVGSEWLYLKLYCGVKTADRVVVEYLAPLAAELRAAGIIEQWFFIRYADPDHHVRVRFRGQGAFYGVVLERLHQVLEPLRHAAVLTDYYTATYTRELERYGWENIEDSEFIFWQDSEAVAGILALLDEGEAGDEIRWQIGLRGVDTFLSDVGLTLPERKNLMADLQSLFKDEFGAHAAAARKSLGYRYRQEKAKVHDALSPVAGPEDELFPVIQILEARSRAWEAPLARIRERHQRGQLAVGFQSLLASYVHMFLNRLLRSHQRQQEMVLYDFLFQAYSSRLAQQRTAAPALALN
ncbi:lantibiotic dehydratase [Hymenobacter actinosclerus]|uniref:Thiopeptide-type bacteriocin biosynthesis domain-containing protein n=1 Tax=Hymenobacter actinosclerus TaxID=82805 RepID=A0A1I0IP17_9BACT|nr:lantibiotic dehydratase [Hymenobacter actinosclerus]SET98879.1 thiopeptide-type bacteriocin biosynthesis domain-containing protein [Hymenobacter actinosclerus]